MAKTLKRAVSLLLIVLMVATCVWSAFSVQAASDALFEDEFTSSTLSGWSANNVGTISGGKYTIDGTGANAAATLGSKKGVAILADVAIDRTVAGNNGKFYNGGTAGLVFHASQDLANGYTFGLGVTKSGTVSAVVTLASGGSTKIIYQRATKITGVAGGKLKRGTTYALKVLMEGDTFACYINNELFYKCDAPAVKEGYIGVSSWCAKATFDSFAVREMGEKKLESISLENTPAEITPAGYFEFDILAQYAGVYGVERVSSESVGVTVTGIDGKLGQKTLTVNYGGKSAQFTTTVVNSTEGKVVYEEDFSGELKDWTLTENTKSGSNRMQVKNGRLYATIPAAVSGSYSLRANYKIVDAVEDCHYAISTDVTMTQNSTSTDKDRECLAVVRFVRADGTWQFRLHSTGEVRLYDGTTTLMASGQVDGIALNKVANMRVELRGNTIVAFVNNKEVLAAQTTAEDITPYLGVDVYNGSAYFDNFKVIKLEKKSKWAAKSIYVENDLGEKVTSYAGRAFNPKKYSLNVTYIDGASNSILMTEDMIQGYDPNNKKSQNVKVVYGNKSVNFAVTYKDYIYYNDFSKSMSGVVSQGNSYAKTNAPYVHKNGMVYVNYTVPENKASVSRYFYFNDSADYANYSVSADIAMLSGDQGKGQYVGVTARNRSGHYFSLRMAYTLGGLEMQLLHYYDGLGNNKIMKTWPQGDLLKTLGEDATAINFGTLYNFKLEVIENELYCYFNNVLIGTATETDEAYTCTPGPASVFCMNTSMIFDNVCVTPLDKRYMTGVEVRGDNVKDGVLQVYQGFEIDPYSTEIVINYNDGFLATEPLWRDYIVENYDPAVLGEQTLTVEYKGATAKLRVNVIDRPDYVAAFAAKVKGFKKGSLTTADLSALNEMAAYQKTLSSYEFEHLDQEVQKAYADLIAEMDRLENETIKDADLIYYNDFNDPNEFGAGTTWEHYDRSGYVGTSNGNLVVEMNKLASTSSALLVQPESYGEIKSIEADVMLLLPATHLALVVYDVNGNYYHVRLSNKVLDENGAVMHTIQLYKMANGGQVKLLQVFTANKNVVVEEGKWSNLRMDLDNGLISMYVDNVLIAQYDDSQATDYIVDGSAGFRISENDAKIANLRVYGTKKEMPKNDYVKQITPTEYKDDFEDETVGKNPSHWIEDNYTDYWKVFNKGGNKVYGISNQKDSWTWLHGFERNPIYNAKIMVTNGTGKAGLLARVTDKVSYLEMGYDFAQKKWYVEADGGEDVATQTYYAKETSAFTLGEWHELETVVQEATVTIKFDGKEVLSYDATKYATIGRMGAYVKGGADLYLDEVYVKSVIGTVFQDGVLEYVINGEDRIGTMELEDLTNDHILGIYGFTDYLIESFDGGQTFEPVKPDSAYYETDFEGGYPSILDLGNGKWMRIMNGYLSEVSYDNMVTWGETNEIYPVLERYDPIYGKMLSMVHTNTLTRYKMADGTMRIFCPVAFRNLSSTGGVLGHYTRFFYTDDEGKTWQEAENDTRDFAPIYNNSVSTTYAEGKVVQCADGTLRYYQTRNVVGCVIYFESTDGGVTWGNFGTIPYMQSPKGSYSVEQDPYNPGTYYMAWVNTYPNNLGNILPRTRISLARTTDGKNWEFLTDVDYTSDFHSGEHNNIRQIVDPSVCVTEDYVNVTFSRASKHEDNVSHNHLLIRYCRLEKDKLTAKAWDDSTIYDSTQAASIKVATLPQTKFGYSDLFSTAGLEIEVTAINGNKTVEGPKEYDIVVEPNMFKLGKQTITLLSKNYLFTSYEIEVVPNYDLIWTIKGKGSVDPDPDAKLRMMEGETQTFTLKPAKGYKVSYVKVNGEKAKIKKNTFTISNVQENQEITVSFVKLSFVDYLPWIILGVVVVAGIGVGCVLLIPRLKKKKAAGEMEDISSSSETPSDEN